MEKKIAKINLTKEIFIEGDDVLTNITAIHIDGFRNIKNTKLRLEEPITVLLAPNNFGKTNILNAIEYAALIVCAGQKNQEILIKRNGYTCYNELDDSQNSYESKQFFFSIEFKQEDGKKITYSFRVSPYGVEDETLKVGNATVFHRSGEVGILGNDKIALRKYNLFVPSADNPLLDPKKNRLLKIIELVKYAEPLREMFFSINNNLLCNRESMSMHMLPNERINSLSHEIDIVEEINQLSNTDSIRYKKFKKEFLGLFPHITDFYIVEVFYGGDGQPSTPTDEYQLQFVSKRKQKLETFRNLSTGTQDIFLLLDLSLN